jgi:hypothetical protein
MQVVPVDEENALLWYVAQGIYFCSTDSIAAAVLWPADQNFEI